MKRVIFGFCILILFAVFSGFGSYFVYITFYSVTPKSPNIEDAEITDSTGETDSLQANSKEQENSPIVADQNLSEDKAGNETKGETNVNVGAKAGIKTDTETDIKAENKINNKSENINSQGSIIPTVITETKDNAKNVPVLMYHFFYDKSANEFGKDNNWIELSNFESHMKYLADNSYYFPTCDELYKYINGEITLPSKSVVVTIDDGNESFFRLAVPILQKYNIKAVSFVVTSWIDNDTISNYKSDLLDFQSHSHDMHRAGRSGKGRFVDISYEEACADLKATKEMLGSPIAFVYPFGHFNTATKKILSDEGFKLAFTTKYGRVAPGMDKLELPRVRISKDDTLTSFINKVK